MKNTNRPATNQVQNILKYRSSGSLLDVGAGYGRHAVFLAQNGFHVTAAEPNTELFAELTTEVRQHSLPIKLIHANLAGIPLDRTYDVVVCTMVLHFLPNRKAVQNAIDHLQKLTSPGGLNVISVLLDKEANNPRPYLFAPGELPTFYEDWELLHYDEELGLPYVPSPKTSDREISSYAGRLIARKHKSLLK